MTVIRSYYVPHSSSGGSGDCDKTCSIIVGSVIGSVFGFFILVCVTCYVYKRVKERRKLAQYEKLKREQDDAIKKLEGRIGPYLDANPHILDMGDYKIPQYLQEVIPGLSQQDAILALNSVAKRRVEQV